MQCMQCAALVIHLGPLLPTVNPSESRSIEILCTEGTEFISEWLVYLVVMQICLVCVCVCVCV